MNADKLLNAISNIDAEFIDEAAYELGSAAVADTSADEKIISIHKKQRIRKMIYIALPSVAAVLLILSVALPAMLRLGKSNTAATAEAPAAASEAASEAVAEEPSYEATAEAEAASEEPSYDAAAEAPAYEAEPEAPAVEAAGEAAESADENKRDAKTSQSLNADLAMTDLSAEYKDGILTIDISDIRIDDLSTLRFTISRIDTPSHEGVIAEGPLSDLTDQTKITGDELILDLSDISLDPGNHRIDLGLFTAKFTVP